MPDVLSVQVVPFGVVKILPWSLTRTAKPAPSAIWRNLLVVGLVFRVQEVPLLEELISIEPSPMAQNNPRA